MSRIKQYTPTVRVNAEDALHDRILLTIGTWYLGEDIGDSEDPNGTNLLRHLTNHLSPAIVELRNDVVSEDHGVIFNRVGRAERGSQRLEFRQELGTLRAGHPAFPATLATGRLDIQGNRQNNYLRLHCDARLSLNATLYMRQRRLRRVAPRHLQPFADIFRQELPDQVNDEWSLDGRQNWLPTDARKRVVWKSTESVKAATDVVERFRLRIGYELQRARTRVQIANPYGFPEFTAEIECALQQVETYYEFFHEEPLRFVEAIASVAQSYANRVTVRRYDLESENQSISIRMELRAGILLRIYAKTNRRVRFEILHNLQESNIPLRGQQSFTDSSQFGHILELLREHAANEVNAFLDFLNEQPIHPAHQFSPFMLVMRVCDAADNSALAYALLEQLCVHRRVVLSETNPLCSLIRRLADRHLRVPVLVNRSRTPVYRLTRSWHHAIRVLSRDGQLSRLAASPVRRAQLSTVR